LMLFLLLFFGSTVSSCSCSYSPSSFLMFVCLFLLFCVLVSMILETHYFPSIIGCFEKLLFMM